MRKVLLLGSVAILSVACVLWFFRVYMPVSRGPGTSEALDDAKAAGRTPVDFPETGSRALDAMDGAIPLGEDERKGRNTWLLWTAGDQVFWDGRHGRAWALAIF